MMQRKLIRRNATKVVELRYPCGAVAIIIQRLLKEDVKLMVDMMALHGPIETIQSCHTQCLCGLDMSHRIHPNVM